MPFRSLLRGIAVALLLLPAPMCALADEPYRAIGTGTGAPKAQPPQIRESEPPLAPSVVPAAALPDSLSAPPPGTLPRTVSPGEYLPPIPAMPDTSPPPLAKPRLVSDTPAPLPTPTVLPALAPPSDAPSIGPIELDGAPIPFETLSSLVDGNICSNCGGGLSAGGCPTCGGCGEAQCRAGGCRAEPFPAKTAAGRLIGLVYSCVCCPDPCYQPRWEPLADAAFFVDAVRPKTSTKFRWDYGSHLLRPDRGEIFFARGDGNGRGPKANAPLRGIPYVDYHELMLVTEAAMGAASVQIAVPYRSVNSTPFGQGGAGFSDMSITAKSMLFDSELLLFGFQMRTYIPIGQTGKGLGVGHVSLEPALNFGLRLAPKTYLQSQVAEWIPIGGDKDYQGAYLRWGVSINHILWQPVKDVKLIGTLETLGISYQDGLFTDPVLGPQPLARRTVASIGPGMRLFFCDTLDLGLGWQHGITGFYQVRDQLRVEVRYRF